MRRENRMKRARAEQEGGVLGRLVRLCGGATNPPALLQVFRQFRSTPAAATDISSTSAPLPTASAGSTSDDESSIAGAGMERLCAQLECTPHDLLLVARQVPRSSATESRIPIGDLCFVVARHVAPATAMERRKALSTDSGIPDDCPLVHYYAKLLLQPPQGASSPSSPPEAASGEKTGLLSPAEWRTFVDTLSVPLPMALRVHNSEPFLQRLAAGRLAHAVAPGSLQPVLSIAPQHVLAYECPHHVYHGSQPLQTLCRSLHSGAAASFQEVVSMLPVLLLGIQPHHRVLDMCAAPGSKTVQGLDALLAHGWAAANASVMLANEKDSTKATQIMPARLKRYHAPNVIVSKCDATKLPRLQDAASAATARFDRVICDVPCSGDGTIRKERSVASSWSEQHVAALAGTQRALLKRAIDMLAVGGIAAYSTCSMNPLEDEAVVGNAMRAFGSSVELLDARATLRALGCPGFQADDSIAPRLDGLVEGFDRAKVLRVLPHRHDTGGFFVALLRKTQERDDTQSRPPNMKLNEWMGHKRWAQVSRRNDDNWRQILAFYGIDDSAVPFQPVYCVNPNGGPQRRICLITNGVQQLFFGTKPYKGPGLEVITMGVRAFELYDTKYLLDAQCRWRVAQECASYVASVATQRKLVLDAGTHRHYVEPLLLTNAVLVSDDSSVWQAASGGTGQPLVKGSVLLGISGGGAAGQRKGEAGDAPLPAQGYDGIWWMSATVNGPRLELAVDSSIKALALLVLYGLVVEDVASKGAAPAAAAAATPLPAECIDATSSTDVAAMEFA